MCGMFSLVGTDGMGDFVAEQRSHGVPFCSIVKRAISNFRIVADAMILQAKEVLSNTVHRI